MTDVLDKLDDIRKQSVRGANLLEAPGGRMFQVLVPAPSSSGVLPPALPYGLHERDKVLSTTPHAEAMWGSAVSIALTKVASMAWDVKGDVALRTQRAQELLLTADSVANNKGWIAFLSKQLRDYTCTGKGCHFEIIRAKQAYGSKIIGIAHLASNSMWMTGDPNTPAIYMDRLGRYHELKWWQVVSISDMPESDEWYLDTGMCAAERAYSQILKMAAIERYVYEKVSATRPLAIHIVNGLMSQDLDDLMASAKTQQMSKGLASYMGAVIMATLKPDTPPSLVTIPLAELPDGFDAEQERSRADLIYANALGLDPQDIRPISNQQLGAGAQSQVLHDKSKGRGLISFRLQYIHAINQLVLDDKTQFVFTERDFGDQEKAAGVAKARADVAVARIGAQITTPDQERQMLVDQDELPKWVIPNDMTEGETLSDTEKPGVEGQADAAGNPLPSIRETSDNPADIVGVAQKASKGVWRTIGGRPILIGGGGGGKASAAPKKKTAAATTVENAPKGGTKGRGGAPSAADAIKALTGGVTDVSKLIDDHPDLKKAKETLAAAALKDPKGRSVKYNEALSQVSSLRAQLTRQKTEELKATSAKLSDLLADRDPMPWNMKITGDSMPQEARTAFLEGVKWGRTIVGSGTSMDNAQVHVNYTDQKGRAFFDSNTNTLHMYKGDDAAIIAHEFIHQVETQAPQTFAKAKAFRDKRTAGEKEIDLAKAKPWAGYAQGEMAKPDDFYDPYVGKVYKQDATEVLTMGVEYMIRDAAGFARKDPEHFAHVWETLVEGSY